jgi:hypothetical protein
MTSAQRFRWFSLLGFAIVAGCLIFVVTRTTPKPHVRLLDRDPAIQDLWPLSQSWVWEVDSPATKRYLVFSLRTKEKDITPQEAHTGSSTFGDTPPKRGEAKEHSVVWTEAQKGRFQGRVTVQFIDYRQVGLEEVVKSDPIGLIIKLADRGVHVQTISLTRNAGHPIGAIFDGSSHESSPKWNGDEILLLTQSIRTDTKRYTHYFFLEQRDTWN